jgi:drug/metabolite transporter (DMT)-like permease
LTPHSRWTCDLALLAVVVIWAVNIPVMKAAIAEMHPFAFNALRLAVSAITLGVFVRRRGPARAPIPWRLVAITALMGSAVYQVLFISGLYRTSGGNAALLVSTSPVWTALIATLFAVERLGTRAWVGLAFACGGAAAIAVDDAPGADGGGTLLGNLLVLGSGLAWGAFAVLSKPLLTTMSPTRLAFWMTVLALPVHVGIALPHLDDAWGASRGAWLAVIYSGVLSTGVAYALWNVAVAIAGPSYATVYTNLIPVLALAGSWIALGEPVVQAQLVGGALVVGGLWIMRRR